MSKIIYICSPLRGDIETNRKKAAEYCKWVAGIGHIPYAPHLYFTEFLDDAAQADRELGMKMGIDFIERMNPEIDELWYFGSEISRGMASEIDIAKQRGIKIKHIPVWGDDDAR